MVTDYVPHIGDWYAVCCWRDIAQIESQEELEDLLDPENELPPVGVWPTQRAAFEALVPGDPVDPDDLSWWDEKYPDIAAIVREIRG